MRRRSIRRLIVSSCLRALADLFFLNVAGDGKVIACRFDLEPAEAEILSS
jgi:hypothetical protein